MTYCTLAALARHRVARGQLAALLSSPSPLIPLLSPHPAALPSACPAGKQSSPAAVHMPQRSHPLPSIQHCLWI
ncbi:hypothetical protein E2C01_013728 [Portunus trituberculatus]|uniref:Uncharacterized protein n=1 Tax=Portunus trituberculatus TaxID=210409 RepID=A0A5B7DH05_PORTR|nr:hypothetical protein [Portunus trituberculatus]